MNENKQKIRYDYEFLKQYIEKNDIVLINNYNEQKITRETIIEAKCLTEGCDDIVSKTFRAYVIFGCYCNKCSVNKGKEKAKILFLEKYGCEYYLQTKEKQLKSKETCLKKFGVENCMQNEEVKNKTKQTCLTKFGCENAMQNKEVREKVIQTNLTRYGCENAMQNKEVREKVIQTFLERYGCENSFLNKEIKDKMENTMLERYGVKYTTQNKVLLNKVKNTFLKNYGTESPFQNQEIKEKIKQTCLEKYGCQNPSQNTEIAEKQSKNAYKSKDYVFPSGRIERTQGYEHFMLNDLLQKENVFEDDIIVKRGEVPAIWYEDANRKKHRYFVDCFIKSQNRCIEVKSKWTAEKKKDNIYLKQQAVKNNGYLCEIWVYDVNGNMVEKIV